MAHTHAARFAAVKDRVDVVAAVDIDKTRAQAVADLIGGETRVATDYRDVLDDVDAVLIVLPHQLHHPVGMECLTRGKHVLMEKPIATNLRDADALIEACESAGVKLGVAFLAQGDRAMAACRDLVRAGLLGRIISVRLAGVARNPDSYWGGGYTGRSPSGWRTSKARSGGGILIMNAIHTIDLCRFITGLECERVYAEYGTYATEVEVEDHIAVAGRLEGGALLSIVATSAAPGRSDDSNDRIIGTHGQIVVGKKAFSTREGVGLTRGEWVDIAEKGGNERTAFVESFVAAVRGEGTPVATGLDGLRALAVVTGAYESMTRGAPVAVER